MNQKEHYWDVLDELNLNAEEKQAVIAFVRDVVQTVVDRHFGLTGLQGVTHDA